MPIFKARFMCVACHKRTAGRFDKCPQCASWNTCEPIKIAAPDEIARALPTLDQIASHEPERVSIDPVWDRALGGGLAKETQIAFWSRPGVGKTTEALRFCSKLGGIFLESEFRDLRKLSMLAERAGIDAKTIAPIYVERPREALDAIAMHPRPVFVVDSLNGLCGVSARRRELAETLEQLREACESARATLIVILQVTRNGSANAPTWVEHMVDTTISLSSTRIHIRKNRYGEAGVFSRGARVPRSKLAIVK